MTEEAKKTTTPNPTKIPKLRSPNYPFIGLEEALERLEKVKDLGRGHYVPVSAARERWGYQQVAGDRTVAALRSYGLLDVQGEGEKRQLKPSDSGMMILENHSRRSELIREAALKPEIHRDLWAKWAGTLPEDPVIREYLRWEKKFNPDNINKFIKQFRDTIKFVGLDESDKIDSENGEELELIEPPPADPKPAEGQKRTDNGGTPEKKPSVLKKGVMYNINIDVLEGGQINITSDGGTMNTQILSILNEVFALKTKYEAKTVEPEPEPESSFKPAVEAIVNTFMKTE